MHMHCAYNWMYMNIRCIEVHIYNYRTYIEYSQIFVLGLLYSAYLLVSVLANVHYLLEH